VFSTLGDGPVIIVTSRRGADAAPDRARALEAAGARVDALATEGALGAALASLTACGGTSLGVEGGAALHRAVWEAGLVDRGEIFVPPHRLGEGAVDWLPFPVISSGRLAEIAARPVGVDVQIEGYVHRAD